MKRTAVIAAFLAALAAAQARAQGFYQQIYVDRPAPARVAPASDSKTVYPAIYEAVMRGAPVIAATEVRKPAVTSPGDYPAIYRRLIN